MKFDEFLEKVKSMGGVDTDGYYGKQCMDLYNYYCNNVLGVQNVGADCAKNILKNQNILNAVEVIENYPEFIVQKGDIVVFRNIGQYGHVAICLGPADINGYKCIEQNWSNTRQLEEVWHDYINYNPVFLRPKNTSNIDDVKVNTRTHIYLPASVDTWRIYPLNKQPVVGNECGKLLPSKFGGLDYDIIRWVSGAVAVIKTRDWGEVQIYVGSDTDAVIS